MQNIRDLSLVEIEKKLLELKEKGFRSKQVYDWLWKKPVSNFDQMTNLSKELREKLKTHFFLDSPIIESSVQGKDNTTKSIFRLYDNLIIEGVLIPTADRVTACISSQVGCNLNCSFCATGKIKCKRNLTAGEIYDQVILLNKLSIEKFEINLSNIVLMGMGEPLLNYDNVLKAINMLTSEDGQAMSPSRITLSTSGLVEDIMKLADDLVKFNLAISLHSADELKRSAIMPINKSNSLKELSKALIYYHEKTKQRITFEYLLLNKYNDTIEDAKRLAQFCKIVPCKVNLIEYNKVEGSHFDASTIEKTEAFKNFLEGKNMIVNIRSSRGKDIDAACGQLAGKTSNQE